MRKMMFLAAVSDYRGLATKLEAAVPEMYNWHAILQDEYGFSDVVPPLADATATRAAILDGVAKLLYGAQPGDQLVAGFWGHGRIVRSHARGGGYEEALIAYPDQGDLKSAEITVSDITKIFEDANVPEGVAILWIIDACFAARADFRVPHGAKIQSIPPTEELADFGDVRRFGSLGRSENERSAHVSTGKETRSSSPIAIIAACGPDEFAVQLPIAGVPRLAFSCRAEEYIKQNLHLATLYEVVREIYPLFPNLPQTPQLLPDESRGSELFPAGNAGTGGIQPFAWSGKLSAAASTPSVIATQYSIDIRFKGICCFADPRDGDTFQKRFLLPYDDRTGTDVQHIAFVEIGEDDLAYWSTAPTAKEPHYNPQSGYSPTKYWRWDLFGHRIEFTNADPSGSFTVSPSYQVHVPQMYRQLGIDGVQDHPGPECFKTYPLPQLIAGSGDIAVGRLTAGPLEDFKTIYSNKDGSLIKTLERSARFVELTLPLMTEQAEIKLSTAAGSVITLRVKNGGTVTIGNMRHADIVEDPSTLDDQLTFRLYHRLAEYPLGDYYLPVVVGVPVNSCSNTNWP